MENIVIGIDLGTTNSCAAYYMDGKVTILENFQGGRTTPSIVYFDKPNVAVVGIYAKQMGRLKPESAVFEIKRLVGRQIDDPYVQNNLRFYPFTVDELSDETTVLIQHPDETIRKTPKEICAIILQNIRSDVEKKLGYSVNKAVITVPAYFNVKQREVTLEAAKQAGFTVLKLLNEPTAAALVYYSKRKNESEQYSLVFDFGGGTFDVAILKQSGEDINIVGVDGDTHLGGQDLDNLIIDYVCKELKEYYEFDPTTDRRIMRRLQNECEDAKKMLSAIEEVPITLSGYIKNHDEITLKLTRTQFENMADDLFQKTISIMDNCLKRCNLTKDMINKVILAGGSTRIPKLRKLLTEYYNENVINHEVNPDECVAEGAALQAAMLSTNPSQKLTDMKITDVTSLSLGIKTVGDIMSVVIKRNTTLPVTQAKVYSNVYDGQTAMSFEIFEGERKNALKNYFLGNFEITGLSPAPPRQCRVMCKMTIDSNGILSVSAKEKYKNNTKDLTVSLTRGLRSDSEVNNTLQDAEEHKDEDEAFVHLAKQKTYLVDYCVGVLHNFDSKDLVSSHKEIYDLCKKIQLQVEEKEMNINTIQSYIDVLQSLCEPIVQQYNFDFMPLSPDS